MLQGNTYQNFTGRGCWRCVDLASFPSAVFVLPSRVRGGHSERFGKQATSDIFRIDGQKVTNLEKT